MSEAKSGDYLVGRPRMSLPPSLKLRRTSRSCGLRSLRHERHRLDPIAVGIADEGRVVAGGPVMRTQAGRAVGGAAIGKRRRMKGIHELGRAHAQADMRAGVLGQWRHV